MLGIINNGNFELQDYELFLEELSRILEKKEFFYEKKEHKFKDLVNQNFQEIKKSYGCYVIKEEKTNKTIYIGKAGTVDQKLKYGKQDINGRLKAVRDKNIDANTWFLELLTKYGKLKIECFIITEKDKIFPAFLESYLLQMYCLSNKELPNENKKF